MEEEVEIDYITYNDVVLQLFMLNNIIIYCERMHIYV